MAFRKSDRRAIALRRTGYEAQLSERVADTIDAHMCNAIAPTKIDYQTQATTSVPERDEVRQQRLTSRVGEHAVADGLSLIEELVGTILAHWVINESPVQVCSRAYAVGVQGERVRWYVQTPAPAAAHEQEGVPRHRCCECLRRGRR